MPFLMEGLLSERCVEPYRFANECGSIDSLLIRGLKLLCHMVFCFVEEWGMPGWTWPFGSLRHRFYFTFPEYNGKKYPILMC